MLRQLSSLRGFTIQGIDGDIGSVQDVYFDDSAWVTRYLVIDTAYWLEDRRVLISPFAVTGIDWYHNRIIVELTRKHLQNSPQLEVELPNLRRQEVAYLDYYGYPHYWAGSRTWGDLPSPSTRAPGSARTKARRARSGLCRQQADSRLRSGNAVIGYQIEAADGPIGRVADLVQDELTWSLRYLLIDARSWLAGRHVLVATQWVEAVSWDMRALFLGLDREAVRSSPAWHAEDLLTHDHEKSSFESHGHAASQAAPGRRHRSSLRG
jgi:hypothetical protein